MSVVGNKYAQHDSGNQGGFSLIEISIVLLIIGLLLGGLMMPLSERLNAQRYSETEDALEEIKGAILGFTLDQRRLPCPDTSGNGIENVPCVDVEGTLPWVTLGVGRLDSWQRPFRYRVDAAFSVVVPDPANTTSGLTINDQAGTALSAPNPDAPVAVIYSCGRDGLANDDNDAAGVDTPNCVNAGAVDTVYIQDVPNDSTANYFDDILIFVSKNIVLNRMANAGKWP
ncbi:MAG: prepilin-type N-terminal cleavage/methylation domain-containing protein [Candidatus Sedimenticola sp. PURPLELP]